MKRAIIACALLLSTVVSGEQQQPVQFETRADVILVDATILDNQGTPIADLGQDDLVVSIDGRPRPIATVQFVKTDPASARPPLKAAHYSTNEGVSDGRRIMIVVDENSIPPGGARAVLLSIDNLLKGLSPVDRVAFIRLPQFENAVDFTVDHDRVIEAVKKTIGKAQRVGFGTVSLAEAVAYDRRDTFQWQRALTRICSAAAPTKTASARPGDAAGFDPADEFAFCKQNAENEAIEKISTYQRRARETLDGLTQVVSNLRGVPGPKTVILLSQGFLSYDRRQDISRLSDMAAAARVSLYAVHIDTQTMELDAVEASFTRSEDERLMGDGIDDLAGSARGARFRIVGNADTVFARMARELPLLRGYTDAFGHALVLSGGVGAMVDVNLNVWDAAATQLLVPEAGGRCETLPEVDGKLGLVFGSPKLVEQLLAFF